MTTRSCPATTGGGSSDQQPAMTAEEVAAAAGYLADAASEPSLAEAIAALRARRAALGLDVHTGGQRRGQNGEPPQTQHRCPGERESDNRADGPRGDRRTSAGLTPAGGPSIAGPHGGRPPGAPGPSIAGPGRVAPAEPYRGTPATDSGAAAAPRGGAAAQPQERGRRREPPWTQHRCPRERAPSPIPADARRDAGVVRARQPLTRGPSSAGLQGGHGPGLPGPSIAGLGSAVDEDAAWPGASEGPGGDPPGRSLAAPGCTRSDNHERASFAALVRLACGDPG